MRGCVPRVGAPVLVAYATFSAHPKGVARIGGLPGSAAASSSARSSAALSPRGRYDSFLPERRSQQLEEQDAPLRARVGRGLECRPKASQL